MHTKLDAEAPGQAITRENGTPANDLLSPTVLALSALLLTGCGPSSKLTGYVEAEVTRNESWTTPAGLRSVTIQASAADGKTYTIELFDIDGSPMTLRRDAARDVVVYGTGPKTVASMAMALGEGTRINFPTAFGSSPIFMDGVGKLDVDHINIIPPPGKTPPVTKEK